MKVLVWISSIGLTTTKVRPCLPMRAGRGSARGRCLDSGTGGHFREDCARFRDQFGFKT